MNSTRRSFTAIMPSARNRVSVRLRCGTLKPSASLIISCVNGMSNAATSALSTAASRE